ncbi:S66 peptidase family protein [Tepidibacter formicigenes]|jgi:muramoyltetrapeptide carboxypeptidase|uniref:Muramoyltetrapeptide carboxypeptidase n=1 Tax=Tepidibacter formicigenes DSM 15518 TaxID=1123349 RepID=A0A1M6M4H9_9FIRM|nr:LD-carboxypeptidase [Tepidibacter formicigenes]SHJ78316.1 muramoyltetrapeptide carboxypeptidase [Tepidibacter formicigenes DSM 15518]
MIIPRNFIKGDTIGVIAPASPVSKKRADKSKKVLENMGFKVKMGESCYSKYGGYLSGEDNLRANDVNNMFADDEVDAVICIRGGYGCSRILDKINFEIIKKNPKLFVGYSDVTALHIAFNQIADLVTYHGPMLSSNMVDSFDEFTKMSFLKFINIENNLEVKNPKGIKIKTLVKGKALGQIVGGNLSIICSMMGTKYEIDTKGKILFIEDIGERPFRIDRMLTQLALSGKLNECIGIIIGDFAGCNPEEESFTLMEVIEDRIKPFNKPTIYNLKSGHCHPMVTLPLGIMCELNADNQKIIIKS